METQQFIKSDSSSYTSAAHGMQPRVLVIGDGSHMDEISMVCSWSNARILSAYGADKMEQNLRDVVACDVIWLSTQSLIEDDLARLICDETETRRCGLICDVAFEHLDAYDALFGDLDSVEFVTCADLRERCIALASVLVHDPMQIHDSAQEQVQEQSDKVQLSRLREEVAQLHVVISELGAQASKQQSSIEQMRGELQNRTDVHAPIRGYKSKPNTTSDAIITGPGAEIRRMISHRRLRAQYFDADLFGEPAWDILLDLYAARLDRRPVTVSSLCVAAAVPNSTAMRWIRNMTKARMLVRKGNPHDKRSFHVQLNDRTADKMRKCLADMGVRT